MHNTTSPRNELVNKGFSYLKNVFASGVGDGPVAHCEPMYDQLALSLAQRTRTRSDINRMFFKGVFNLGEKSNRSLELGKIALQATCWVCDIVFSH